MLASPTGDASPACLAAITDTNSNGTYDRLDLSVGDNITGARGVCCTIRAMPQGRFALLVLGLTLFTLTACPGARPTSTPMATTVVPATPEATPAPSPAPTPLSPTPFPTPTKAPTPTNELLEPTGAPTETPSALTRGHPVLLASTQDFATLKKRVSEDPGLKLWYTSLKRKADGILGQPVSTYQKPDGIRLLDTSRRVLDRIYTLALVFRLSGDIRYLERTWRELDSAADFPDWNPSHFLDTAEMTHAFAIGYDWLYESWSEQRRASLRLAMVEKGLRPALKAYDAKPPAFWVTAAHNWNLVCNGGIGMGALALMREEPTLAGEVLRRAVQSLQSAMPTFAPDGGWNEGPGYWAYATQYLTTFVAAAETSLGTDFGLLQAPGLSETGLFPIYLTGPMGRTFNFADGHDSRVRAPWMFWLASRYRRPVYAWYGQQAAAPSAQDVLWHGSPAESPAVAGLPLDKHFRGVGVVTLRSTWGDNNATFVGFKAGDNKANHSHLDLGSFVLDALGVRWALDLGSDNYNLPGYFDQKKGRWTYYRMRAEGHNTLVLNPGAAPGQDPKAAASIIRFQSQPARAIAVADLTSAYAGRAGKVLRGVALLDRKSVLVQDEVQASQPVELWWFMHTAASLEVGADGRTAVLTQGDKRLWARILSPEPAMFTPTLMDAQPLPSSPSPAGQNANTGVRKLAIHLANVTNVRLAVLLVPLAEGESPPTVLPESLPTDSW